MKLMDLRAQARRMKLKNDVQIIFIDYIGLIEYEDQSLERFNQVSQISRSLKQLARELDIPIVCLCQVNRQAEGMEPKLSDLRDSGSIEQDADQVILLHRDKIKENNEDRNAIQETKLIMEDGGVVVNRHDACRRADHLDGKACEDGIDQRGDQEIAQRPRTVGYQSFGWFHGKE